MEGTLCEELAYVDGEWFGLSHALKKHRMTLVSCYFGGPKPAPLQTEASWVSPALVVLHEFCTAFLPIS
jgi:hypothetical protein